MKKKIIKFSKSTAKGGIPKALVVLNKIGKLWHRLGRAKMSLKQVSSNHI